MNWLRYFSRCNGHTDKKPPSALIWPLLPVSWWLAGGYVVVSPVCRMPLQDLSVPDNLIHPRPFSLLKSCSIWLFQLESVFSKKEDAPNNEDPLSKVWDYFIRWCIHVDKFYCSVLRVFVINKFYIIDWRDSLLMIWS